MSQVRHRLLLLYPAGIISLFLLPLLGGIYLINFKTLNIPRVMEINLWDERDYVNGLYNGYQLDFQIHPRRTFLQINLTGDQKEDKRKLDLAQIRVREIVKTNDTLRGVRFHFENQSKFGSYIRALDICFREKSKTFIIHGDDLWMFYYVPKPQPPVERYLGGCGGNFKNIETQIPEKGIPFLDMAQIFWVPGLLYLTLTVLAIWNLSKFPGLRNGF